MSRVPLSCVVLLVVLGSASRVLADSAPLASPEQGVLGEVKSVNQDGVPADLYTRYNLVASRSYAALCWAPKAQMQAPAAQQFCTISFRSVADANLGTTLAGTAEGFPSGGDAQVYTPSASGPVFVRVHNQSGFVQFTASLVVETTLFSPWYYIAAASGYNGFITIKNNTKDSVTYVATVFNSAGVAVGAPVSQALGANANAVIDISATYGLTAGQGSAQVSHNSLPGAISANITTISGMTGLSFDAPFTPRMVWSTFGTNRP